VVLVNSNPASIMTDPEVATALILSVEYGLRGGDHPR